jgi:hypothetical protein
VVRGTIAVAGHCSVAGQLDGDVLVDVWSATEFDALARSVELAGGELARGDDGAERAPPAGGAAHDDNRATEASPISAADARHRSSTRNLLRVRRPKLTEGCAALARGRVDTAQVMRAEFPPGWSRTPVAADSTAAFGNEIGPSLVCIIVNIKLMAVTRPSYWPPSAPARKVM